MYFFFPETSLLLQMFADSCAFWGWSSHFPESKLTKEQQGLSFSTLQSLSFRYWPQPKYTSSVLGLVTYSLKFHPPHCCLSAACQTPLQNRPLPSTLTEKSQYPVFLPTNLHWASATINSYPALLFYQT